MIHQHIDWTVAGICLVVITATFAALWALHAALYPDPPKVPRSDEQQ